MIRPKLEFLSRETVHRVIDEAYELLWDPGVRVHYDEALRLLADAGATVDTTTRVAKIPRSLAEKAVDTAPSSFYLYNLDGQPVVHYGGDDIHYDPGSAAIEIADYDAKQSRTPVTADCENFVRLAEMLPQIDALATSIVCGDVPQSMADWYRLYLLLLYGRKPIVTGTFAIESFPIMHELLVASAGSAAAVAAKPRAIFDVCPSPPLLWSDITCANLIDAARTGVPAELVSMPLMGATGPATVIGSAVQHAAECLSGLDHPPAGQGGQPDRVGWVAGLVRHAHRHDPNGRHGDDDARLHLRPDRQGDQAGRPADPRLPGHVRHQDRRRPDRSGNRLRRHPRRTGGGQHDVRRRHDGL